ncbi:MAG: hypothetical protein ACJAX4_003181 [Clostridium sp.]|jgi:hypothetical protein
MQLKVDFCVVKRYMSSRQWEFTIQESIFLSPITQSLIEKDKKTFSRILKIYVMLYKQRGQHIVNNKS